MALALMVIGFIGTIASFPETWTDSRTHGFVVLAFCLWMLWTDRRRFGSSPPVRWPARLVAVTLSAIWLVATITGVRVVHQAMMPAVFLLWATAVYGERGWRLSLPVGLVFLLAVPFWEVLLGPLQWMTVQTNSAVVDLLDLGARIDGQRIHFPFGTIEVAESCAGLSYFMSALTIAVIYSRLFLRTLEGTVVAIATAVTLAIVSNWVRVFGLILVGYQSRMQSPLMAEHATYGWIIFAVVISLFFAATGRLERWDARVRTRFDLWAKQLPATSPGVGEPSRRNVFVSTLAVMAGPLVFYIVSIVPSDHSVMPETPGIASRGWIRSVPEDSAALWSPAFSGYTERRRVVLTRATATVQIDRIIFAQQRQGAELVGGGNRIADDVLSERIVGPLDANLRMVREVIVRTPGGGRLVWYWYRVAGVATPSPARAKLLEIVAFFSRRSASELVAISVPCGPRDCSEASQAAILLATGKELISRAGSLSDSAPVPSVGR